MCDVFAVEGTEGEPQQLRATCNGRGLILGPATTYKIIPHEKLAATLIDMQFVNERHVWLLSVGADGLPLLEDISGQIALAAGRGPMSGIEDVEVDLDEFTGTGRVSVHPGDRTEAGRGELRQLALDEQLERERTR